MPGARPGNVSGRLILFGRMAPVRPLVLGSLPLRVDLQLYQGDDFTMTIAVTTPEGDPADLTGATAKAEIRPRHTDDVVAEFLASIEDNVVTLHLTNADAAALPQKAVWDCEVLLASGEIRTLAYGEVATTLHVTRGAHEPVVQEPEEAAE